MNVAEFIAKWRSVELTERSASQQHFLDLCEVLEHPKPAEIDAKGDFFTFERGAAKRDGSNGWADVWKKDYFAWEYKGRHKDLVAAYKQLDDYRVDLGNPPLLVTCDMGLIVVHTNYTATHQEIHRLELEGLSQPKNLEILRAVFHAPHKLKPGAVSEVVTAEAARRVADIALALRDRGLGAEDVARFLDRMVFALFAEDVGLIGGKVVTRLLEQCLLKPGTFPERIQILFEAMRLGGYYGADEIRHFNGNLFDSSPTLELTHKELNGLVEVSRLDWSSVDPSIFGTLFVRGMDPDMRAQLGAQYTSREDIEVIVEPVVLRPLRRQWRDVQQRVSNLLETGRENPGESDRRKSAPSGRKLDTARKGARRLLLDFHQRLLQFRVLDPACGSGNFLYVTLQKLKDLEKELILFALEKGFPAEIPLVGPWQLHGIEVNRYAFELAQMTVWIGYLQWTKQNGMGSFDDPVLRPMDTFSCKDAILDLSDPQNPREPEWPKVDCIIGNPPFLGGKKLRRELGDDYVDRLFRLWRGRVPAEADLVAYWLEKARHHLEQANVDRVGLLATQGIRGGANREVVQRIKETGTIFFAESDRNWLLEGASVHVSMIGFGRVPGVRPVLDGREVDEIHSDLSAALDVTAAKRLAARRNQAFMADTKGGAFDLEPSAAVAMLKEPNAYGAPNSNVVVPWVNGKDVTQRGRGKFIIDFGRDRSEIEAAKYEAPFEYLRQYVLPDRLANKRRSYRERWWVHVEPRPAMRAALQKLPRFLVTPTVSKHRLFTWIRRPTLADHQLIAFPFESDYHFGLLQSRVHELWARVHGTQVRERESGFRYIPTQCFETFPFPEPSKDKYEAVSWVARELDEGRERWLNPPEWVRHEILEFPGVVDGPWGQYVEEADARRVGVVRYPLSVPRDTAAGKGLARRTLTNLYNQRPAWLENAHKELDAAVAAAYGWPLDLSDDQIIERLLRLNLDAAPAASEAVVLAQE